jgi:hypothetical protein
MKINTSLTSGDAHGDLITSQLNLAVAPRSNRRRARRPVSRSRAAYWFDRMRKAVNAARDWQPSPAPRPQQTYINLQPTNS